MSEVDDDSKQLLTINTHRGFFRFNWLALDLRAPGVKFGAFHQLMSSMVADLEEVDNFLDDIFIYLQQNRRRAPQSQRSVSTPSSIRIRSAGRKMHHFLS